MKQTNILTYCILFLISLSACSKDYPCTTMEEHFREYYYKPEAIKKSKIKSRTKIDASRGRKEYVVLFSTSKTIPAKKVRAVDYFNEAGYLTLSVVPKYEMHKTDTNGFSRLSSMEQLVFTVEVETNMPSGKADSTIFSYDSKNRLISKEQKKQTLSGISYTESLETFEYDDRNNLVKFCLSSENRPKLCRTTIYKYDEKGRILSKINEMPEEILHQEDPKQNEIQYSYYADGKLKSEGDENYLYENDQLKEKYVAFKNHEMHIFKYQYDKGGNLTCVKEVLATWSSRDTLTGKYKAEIYEIISTLNFTFDQRKLITEWYSPETRDVYTLYKYQYE